MANLYNELLQLFKDDLQIAPKGNVQKKLLAAASIQPNESFLEKLLTNKKLADFFFVKAGKIFVFDKIKFQQFLNNKDLFAGSATFYNNKIGISQHNTFISRLEDVVLTWPYKDCVLEGGQTHEESSRKEIMWNEILAPNEIDRLLSPKCFTNFKKYTAKGSSAITSISPNDNLIIKGNNLLVLHSLLPKYAGKIKLIYIDPPYNTGNDSFLYNDNFNHSTWLTFMKNRLEVAWKLLADDGCIFIQTDDEEAAYLKVLCDELLGRNNFRENIILKSSTESGVNAINVKRGERLFKVKENILFYSKSPNFRFKFFYTKAPFNTNYKYEVIKKGGQYFIEDIQKKFFEKKLNGAKKVSLTKSEILKIDYEFAEYALTHAASIYSLEKNIKKAGEKFKTFAASNKTKGIVEEFTNKSGEKILVYDGGALVPLKERVIEDQGQKHFGILASDLWVDIGTTASNEGGIRFQNGKKPEKLLKRIIEMTTNEGDLVLDYHLGSGTTAAVAHKLKRQYIGIEQMDYGENDSIVRLQNVINGEQSGISKVAGWQGGGSFISMDVLKINEHLMEEILKSKSLKVDKLIFKKIKKTALISFDVQDEWINGKNPDWQLFSVDERKQFLIRFLDLNYLYLPYTERADKDFQLTPKDIAINEAFYQKK
ncbi:MAG: site-specific DNA-methyltransferase [Bacteroidetes bacterium]|nr:site-specific DNA-methyltransferase [Bacteroidota bacterium]